jgi:hypothetical protein
MADLGKVVGVSREDGHVRIVVSRISGSIQALGWVKMEAKHLRAIGGPWKDAETPALLSGNRCN